jgi:ribosomal protein S18 acetylase RimI-like enzyme
VVDRELRDGDMEAEPGRTLVTELWADMAIRYADDPTAPETKGETDDLRNEEVLPPDGRFVIVLEDGAPVACGAIRRHDVDTAEIKRMWVRPEARGRGIARLVLRELESSARAQGYRALVLETGLRQPEALALYESHGYTTIPNFGFYKESPLSVCYRKELGGEPSSGTS